LEFMAHMANQIVSPLLFSCINIFLSPWSIRHVSFHCTLLAGLSSMLLVLRVQAPAQRVISFR
jgi:hypothetical protein